MTPVYDEPTQEARALRREFGATLRPVEIPTKGRDLAALIVSDLTYLENLIERARKGELPPALETRIWEYVYGKPAEVKPSQGMLGDLSELSNEELLELARKNNQEAEELYAAAERRMGRTTITVSPEMVS